MGMRGIKATVSRGKTHARILSRNSSRDVGSIGEPAGAWVRGAPRSVRVQPLESASFGGCSSRRTSSRMVAGANPA